MKFCTACGARLPALDTADPADSILCPACSKSHYRNPCVTVGCIAYYDDRVLMCRRAEEPASGLWSIPSGYLECGETLEQATARETLEETGVVIDPEILDLYNVINMTDAEQVSILFRIRLSDEPKVLVGVECAEAAFMSENQIATLDLAWQPSLGMEIRDFFQQLRTGNFAIRLVCLASATGASYSCRSYTLIAGNDGFGRK